MSILAAYAVPHPPLIVPAVGRGEEAGIPDTVASFDEVARRAAAHKPQTIVITSPHAPFYRDAFFISNTPEEKGSMAAFRAPGEAVETQVDLALVREIADIAGRKGIPLAGSQSAVGEIDHGAFVPLHFLSKHIDLGDVQIVRIGLSLLDDADHLMLGRAISQAAQALGRRVVLVASGDWSHKLKADGPYGFVPEGPEFDSQLAGIFESGSLSRLFEMDPVLCEDAAECGLRSFKIMAGALEGQAYTAELLSYEGPFGVGYGVAAFEVEARVQEGGEDGEAGDASLAGAREVATNGAAELGASDLSAEIPGFVDPYVSIARQSVEHFVRTGKELKESEVELPHEELKRIKHRKAGAFVSLHEHGSLRGCIGTISAARHNLLQEIIDNGVSACSRDPRFNPVQESELDALSYSVDILGDAEEVFSLEQLDPKRYGVIVTKGRRRGLLLPDLEGVDTVQDQIAIAKQKAGIMPYEDVRLERFEVVRHSAGGEARDGS